MTIVPGFGRTPNRVLLCGEAPGKTEAKRGRPFAGKSGEEQKWYLSPYRINPDHWYMTNVVKTYLEGNPDPTPELILEWTPELIKEVHLCNPQLIIAVGRFAIQWFLGDRADLDSCHGIPHKPGAFDASRASRSPQNSIILPIYHPAAGFYKAKVRPLIQEDYRVVVSTIKKLQSGEQIEFRHDHYAGREDYRDVTGKQLESALKSAKPDDLRYLGLDTEGYPRRDMHWSTQVSWQPGIAYVLRTSQPDLQRGIQALQSLADTGRTTFIAHDASTPSGCLYDLTMSSVVGLNYSRAPLYNTMYAAYLTRLEPKGLKPLCWRFNGMYMEDYHSLIGDVARQKQLDYLIEVSCRNWPKPEPQLEHDNDGTSRLKTYQHITRAVNKIIADVVAGKVTKEGPSDPLKRWKKLDPIQVKHVESIMGPMPIATLDDVPLEQAIIYAAKDADGTRRLMFPLMERLKSLDLQHRMPDDMQVAPIFWEMQQNGMPADRKMFFDLGEQMSERMYVIGAQLSHKYFSGRPFNPGSTDQVRVLLRRRGLKASKLTDTGDESTAKKSIEHLRFIDPAIGLVFDWREPQHIRDSFCKPILKIIPEDQRFYNVRSNLRIADTETRRLSSSNPNHLNIPVRTDIGRAVRSCYRLAEDSGQVLYAADLSQIELRILADESNSKFLISEFLKPKSDPHKQIAMRVFGIADERDVDEFKHRLPAKTTIYGISYGQQDQGLSDQLRMLGLDNWDVKACGELRREILSIIGINDYKDRLISSARSRGYIRDRGGMYRYLPDLRSRDRKLSAEAERHVVSSRIQGTAQTAIQNSMRHLRPSIQALSDSGHDIKWRLQVHDELILTCPREDVEIVDYLCLNAMTNHHGLKLKIPIVAKGHTATTWGELK